MPSVTEYPVSRYPTPRFERYSAEPVGLAFARRCRRRTPQSDSELRDAIGVSVRRSKMAGVAPERVIVALKAAVVAYSGLREQPSLVNGEETSADGEHCVVAYRQMFAFFLDAYFDGK